MRRAKPDTSDIPVALARQLPVVLARERIVPRFVDSYVVEHGRYGLQVHASLYRDLLALLQREALLAMSVHALAISVNEPPAPGKSKPRPMLRKDAAVFRRKFVTALTREQRWNAGDALDFQTDLKMYEDLLARAPNQRRGRKPFETCNHPFVDRCAFVLDSSFLENARLAATHALDELEKLAQQTVASAREPRIVRPPG
jgi:hypothetical protein